MTTPILKSLIDEQIEELPADRMILAGLEEGVWPRLEPSGTANLISWATVGGSSRVDYVSIRPNWRYL